MSGRLGDSRSKPDSDTGTRPTRRKSPLRRDGSKQAPKAAARGPAASGSSVARDQASSIPKEELERRWSQVQALVGLELSTPRGSQSTPRGSVSKPQWVAVPTRSSSRSTSPASRTSVVASPNASFERVQSKPGSRRGTGAASVSASLASSTISEGRQGVEGLILEVGRRRIPIVPPPHLLPLPLEPEEMPDEELVLNCVYGCGGRANDRLRASGCCAADRVWSLGAEEVVYAAGVLAVVYNLQAKTQRFFAGHSRRVSALAVRQTCELVASAQEAARAERTSSCVCVWRPSDLQEEARIVVDGILRVDVLEWSRDGSYLVGCVTNMSSAIQERRASDKLLKSIYIWNYSEPGHPLVQVVSCQEQPLGLLAHYADPGCFVVYGTGHLLFLSVGGHEPDGLRQWAPRWEASGIGPPKAPIISAAYLLPPAGRDDALDPEAEEAGERLLAVGSAAGEVFLLRRNAVVLRERRSHEPVCFLGPAPLGYLFCGTADGQLVIMDSVALVTTMVFDFRQGFGAVDLLHASSKTWSMTMQDLLYDGSWISGRVMLTTDQHCLWSCDFRGGGPHASVTVDASCVSQSLGGDILGMDVNPAQQEEIAVSNSQGVIRFFDTLERRMDRRRPFVCSSNCGAVECVAFNPTGLVLAAGTEKGRLVVLSTPLLAVPDVRGLDDKAKERSTSVDCKELANLPVCKEQLTCLQWTMRGDRLAVGATDSKVYLYTVATDCSPTSDNGGPPRLEARHTAVSRPRVLATGGEAVACVQFSACGRFVMANTVDLQIVHWDALTGRRTSGTDVADVRWFQVSSGVVSPRGANDVGVAHPWRCNIGWPTTGLWPRRKGDVPGEVTAIESSPGRPLCIVGDKLGRISLLRFPVFHQDARAKVWQAHSSPVSVVRWTGGTRLMTFAGTDGIMLQWSLVGGVEPSRPKGSQYRNLSDSATANGRGEDEVASGVAYALGNVTSELELLRVEDQPTLKDYKDYSVQTDVTALAQAETHDANGADASRGTVIWSPDTTAAASTQPLEESAANTTQPFNLQDDSHANGRVEAEQEDEPSPCPSPASYVRHSCGGSSSSRAFPESSPDTEPVSARMTTVLRPRSVPPAVVGRGTGKVAGLPYAAEVLPANHVSSDHGGGEKIPADSIGSLLPIKVRKLDEAFRTVSSTARYVPRTEGEENNDLTQSPRSASKSVVPAAETDLHSQLLSHSTAEDNVIWDVRSPASPSVTELQRPIQVVAPTVQLVANATVSPWPCAVGCQAAIGGAGRTSSLYSSSPTRTPVTPGAITPSIRRSTMEPQACGVQRRISWPPHSEIRPPRGPVTAGSAGSAATQEVKVTLRPGPLNLLRVGNRVLEVKDGPAKEAGVQAGWLFRSIDGVPFREEWLQQKECGESVYTVMFEAEVVNTAVADASGGCALPLCSAPEQLQRSGSPWVARRVGSPQIQLSGSPLRTAREASQDVSRACGPPVCAAADQKVLGPQRSCSPLATRRVGTPQIQISGSPRARHEAFRGPLMDPCPLCSGSGAAPPCTPALARGLSVTVPAARVSSPPLQPHAAPWLVAPAKKGEAEPHPVQWPAASRRQAVACEHGAPCTSLPAFPAMPASPCLVASPVQPSARGIYSPRRQAWPQAPPSVLAPPNPRMTI